jgi:uncharacterized lipoprotein YddW (UPF0748 family)
MKVKMKVIHITQNTVFKTSTLNSTRLPSSQKVSISQGQILPIHSATLRGNHYLVRLQQSIPPVGAVGYFYGDHVRIEDFVPSPLPLQNRGVWLTNVDSEVLFSRESIEAAVERLAELNFNTLYPVVWNRGYTLYPSRVAEQVTGSSIAPQPQFRQRDMLAELLQVAKAHKMRVIPWFEYGLMAPPNSLLAYQHPGWLTQKVDGYRIHDQMVWLNPTHPDVIQFMTSLIQETVRNYDIDGIQLDDHFGMPVELGYDDFTKALYHQKTGKEPPTKHTDPEWMAWRINQITELMSQIFWAVKAVKPNCLVSLSPNPQDFSVSHYLVDWHHWERIGFVEEIVVQLYRDNLSSFEAELLKPELIAARQHIPVSIGILSGLKPRPISLSQIQQQISIARKHNYTGVSFFFYETVVNHTLSPLAVGDRQPAQLKKLFA